MRVIAIYFRLCLFQVLRYPRSCCYQKAQLALLRPESIRKPHRQLVEAGRRVPFAQQFSLLYGSLALDFDVLQLFINHGQHIPLIFQALLHCLPYWLWIVQFLYPVLLILDSLFFLGQSTCARPCDGWFVYCIRATSA